MFVAGAPSPGISRTRCYRCPIPGHVKNAVLQVRHPWAFQGMRVFVAGASSLIISRKAGVCCRCAIPDHFKESGSLLQVRHPCSCDPFPSRKVVFVAGATSLIISRKEVFLQVRYPWSCDHSIQEKRSLLQVPHPWSFQESGCLLQVGHPWPCDQFIHG